MKEKFIEIYRKYITRPGAEDLLAYLEKSDFFTAPASGRFHLSVPGGLCQHSINVYEQLRDQYEHFLKKNPEFTELTPEQEETIAICGLLHDLCKINFYVPVKKSRKTGKNLPNGKPEWEDYWGYDIEDKLPYGHGEKSVYIASGFMRLTREEAFAIRFHMGAWQEGEARNAGSAFEMYPLALFTHIADMLATNINEKE
ncbi:MAG: HD domain-containing protein [Oscillospiraceae bacterium]|nr:HD domain-containing protein [Oscillospiraceae bacterium]